MTSLIAILRREYLQRVRSRWFLLATFLAPLFFLAMMILPGIFAHRSEATRRTLAVADETGALFQRVAPRLVEAGFTVEEAAPGSEALLLARIERGELGGYLALGPEALSRGRVVYHGKEGPGAIRGLSIRGAVAQSALELRLGESGSRAELAALLSGGTLELRLVTVEGGGAREDDPKFVAAFIGALLLYMVILLYAVAVMRATLEEKTSRIVEILISSVRPWELMLGKILGVGAVGLTQLAIWVLFGVVAFTMGIPALVAARPEVVDPALVRQALPGPELMLLFLGLFLGGYFLYSALYAAVGAMCSTEEEAQQAQFPVVMLLVFPILFLMPVIESPNSTLAVASSLVPFFAPILMYGRAASGVVPLWQIALALAILFASVGAVAWLAGRIYRVGILMQGKRPTLPELWRWVREA